MLRWLTIIATLGMIAVNGLANALPINGKTTGEIANGFDILFTPAGYVFSIWGLIYLGLTGFAIVQALPSQRGEPAIPAIRPWFLLNTVGNASWIVLWHHEFFVLSWFVMLVILGSLIGVYRILLASPPRRARDLLWVQLPFRIYLGWISVATIANTTVTLSSLGLAHVFAGPSVTLGILLGATALCVLVVLRFHDPAYAAVFVWAEIGIAVANPDHPLLQIAAFALAAVCAAAGVRAGIISRRTPRTRSAAPPRPDRARG